MTDPRSQTRQSIKKLLSSREVKKPQSASTIKQKNKRYRNRIQRINSTYGKSEIEDFKEVVRLAAYHEMEKSVYQKKACLAYGRNGKVIPQSIKKGIFRLITESKRANTLVAEWTKHASIFQKTSTKHLEKAALHYRKLIKQLESLLWQLSK